ncbi:MAG: serine--tRNA ligase [Rhodospirillaceae bacterium]|jgi:seryl-tRNA synthetase|nr:serine--tRNA ligase [Rhodospirillaceae bacterium]
MFDIRWIRENPDTFDQGLAARGLDAMAAELIELDAHRRAVQTRLQENQTRRNEVSKQVGAAKGQGDDAAAEALIEEVAQIKAAMQAAEEEERRAAEALTERLSGIPNLPLADVPVGPDEETNLELRKVGDTPAFDFAPKQHFELGEAMGLMDFEAAAKLSGARFVVLKGALARLERALAQFMLDTHTAEFGYTEVSPPMLVRDTALYGTGQLPKFGQDLFRTTADHWLIPTAEVPLTNLVAGEILNEDALPMRVTAFTGCFRAEAGAAGRDTRGMLRQHQFYKVELVSVTTPDESDAELERMTGCAEAILQRLDLPYRAVLLSSGDMGFSARKTYDLEVWLPGQDAYREVSSCSNCGEFQARRMNARYRPKEGKGTRHVHTLNGSGLAVGRVLIGVLENHQKPDGTVELPAALRPYMGGVDILGADV